MKRIVYIAAWFLLVPIILQGESLWEPAFSGYITGSSSYTIGDSLIVIVDSSGSLSVDATLTSSKRLDIELTGGEGERLFSFLPGGSSSGSESLDGSQEIEIRTTLPVRVVEVDSGGFLSVEGTRSLSVFGKTETVSISGVVDPELIGDGRRISLGSIADASLTYTTTLDPTGGIISVDDIEEVEVPPAQTQNASGQVPAAGIGGSASVIPVEAVQSAAEETETQIQLTDEKQRELLLRYLNRMIDLLLAQP